MFFFGWPPFPLLGLFTYLLNVTSYCNAWLLVCQDSAPKGSHWLVNSLNCHLTFSFSWSLLTLLKLFLLFESSILNFQPKHRKGASIASAPSSLRGRKRETQKPGDCILLWPWEKTLDYLDYSQNFTKTKSPMQRNGRTASNSDTTFVCAESSNPARGFPFVPASEWRTWPQGGWKGWGWFLRQFQDVGPGQCPILLCWTSLAVGTSSQATSKSIPAQWIWNAYTAWPGSPKI